MHHDQEIKSTPKPCVGSTSSLVSVPHSRWRNAKRSQVMGREVPTYCIRREPRNWGWVMESCWVAWSSVDS